jgi:hypothetical protein
MLLLRIANGTVVHFHSTFAFLSEKIQLCVYDLAAKFDFHDRK